MVKFVEAFRSCVRSALPGVLIALAALLLAPAAANAQATRTWVSGLGDDLNPCSRTAPCKTFAGAISKTAAGGQISTLDPGSFGAVTITKSISIVSDLGFGGIINAFTSGVIINAGVDDVVALHGLVIDGSGQGGLNGIRFIAGKSLHVSSCIIRNQTGAAPNGFGITMERSNDFTTLFVSDCDISRGAGGIKVKTTATGQSRASLNRVTVEGLSGPGITAEGAGAVVRIGDSLVTRTSPGLSAIGGGQIISHGNNQLRGNNPDVNPTSTAPLQ